MGIYCTTTSLQTTMIGTTFDTATTALATKMITKAENEINKYLSKRYDISSFYTTTASVPPLITTIAEDLSEGYMHQKMSRGGKEAMARGKEIITQAIDNLKMIADFDADLLDSSGDVIADMSNTSMRVLCNTSTYTSTFDEDNELDWSIDSDKLDDISAARD